ncbi:SDR family oxidoreductase [Spirulina sp. CS-785/01]|uniref:SDR family oxidoreductase n=1 Tax=Spirulina sp. CS-785/01 TaxID=3021716 RepID=UPI0023309A2C|nr:SDR family oxidoreductase [Spirulina sp. CS-785/01]MDB9313303.1 SDR family oxidoreductase [Spirulina sp. CS-785/01]
MKALVAGATGRTGKRIVDVLVEQGISVKALVRNLEKGQQTVSPEAELVVGDVLQPDSLQEAIEGCDVVFCATGATPSFDLTGPYRVDYEGTKNLIDVAKTAEIQQFVLVSSLCVSQFFHPLNLFWLVLYWKKQAEDYLKQSGLTYTIVRPGGLLDTDNPDPIVLSEEDTLFDGRIPRRKVAEVAVAALSQSAAQNTILETIAKPEAEKKDWSELFATVT